MLEAVGLGACSRTGWPTPRSRLWTLFLILTWKYLGFAIILMLAGLQGVPEELAEAAAIDGASWWQIQRAHHIPLLGPTIRIWAFLSMIGALQLFDMVGHGRADRAQHGHRDHGDVHGAAGPVRGQPGYGSAIAVILFFISLIVALVYQRFALRRDLAGAITEECADMTATTSITTGLPPEDLERRTAGRGFDWGQPFVYPSPSSRRWPSGPWYMLHRRLPHHGRPQREPGRPPDPWTLQNWVTVLGAPRFWGNVFASIVLAAGTTLGVVIVGIMAAFVIARYEFRGRQGLYTLFTSSSCSR